LTPRTIRRLTALLERACPTEIDPVLWRQRQEAVRAEALDQPKPVYLTATGKPGPHEGYADAYPPCDPRPYY
jgi:hypothetical protein